MQRKNPGRGGVRKKNLPLVSPSTRISNKGKKGSEGLLLRQLLSRRKRPSMGTRRIILRVKVWGASPYRKRRGAKKKEKG